MATKPILTIDVDDTQFKAFYELFGKYKEDLDKMPESWRSANDVLNLGLAAAVEQLHAVAVNTGKATHAQKEFAKATTTSGKRMSAIERSSHRIERSLFKASKWLLKWSGLGSGFLGLGGLLGGFGLDKLANTAIQAQYRARGLGITTGQQRAWQLNYRRIAPPNFLGSVFGMQHNLSQLGNLSYVTGLSPDTAATMSPIALAQLVLRRAHRYGREYGHSAYMMARSIPMMHAFGQLGLNVQDVERLGNTSGSALASASAHFQRDAKSDQITDQATRNLFRFSRELHQIGTWITGTLANHLQAVGGPLTKLARALGSDFNALLSDALSKEHIDALRRGINDFTQFITSGRMDKAFNKMANGLESLGSAASHVASILDPFRSFDHLLHNTGTYWGGVLFNATHPSKHAPDPNTIGFGPKSMYAPGVNKAVHHGLAYLGHGMDYVAAWLMGRTPSPKNQAGRNAAYALTYKHRYSQAITTASRDYGLPPHLLRALIANESSGNPNAVSGTGAMGLTQLEPSTARMLGVKNPFNAIQNIAGGAKFLSNMIANAKRFYPKLSLKQQVALGLTFYEMGVGNFNKALSASQKKYTTSWASHVSEFMGPTAKAYANRVMDTAKFGASYPTYGTQPPILQRNSGTTRVEVTMHEPVTRKVVMAVHAAGGR